MAPKWSREEALSKIRPRLWQYLRSHAAAHALGSYTEQIWQLAAGEFDQLIAVHLLLDPATDAALQEIADALPRLPSTIARSQRELVGMVQGPVDWANTQRRRTAAGDPTLFVCRPAARRYETPPARLCRVALHTVLELALASGLAQEGELGAKLAARGDQARLLSRHPKMVALRDSRLDRTALDRIAERWPYLERVSAFVARVLDARFHRLPEVLEEVIAGRLLAPAEPDVLFELEVAFGLIDGFLERGFVDATPPHLISDAARQAPLARLVGAGQEVVDLYWQRSPWTLGPGQQLGGGLLRDVLQAAGMRRSSFRPDLILHFLEADRVVLVEVKLTERDGVAAERRGITEAFAYLLDADPLFANKPVPHALVVAWNSTGLPAARRVALCNQNGLGQAVDLILGRDCGPPQDVFVAGQ